MSDRELKKGVELCLNNANSLIEDAELLLKQKSYGHASFLAISAIEETSKAYMYATNRIEIWESEESKDDILQHKPKFMIFLCLHIVEVKERGIEDRKAQKTLDISDFKELAKDFESAIKDLWNFRLQSLYVDYENGRWLYPSDIKLEDAESSIEHAKKYKKRVDSLCTNILSIPANETKKISGIIDELLFHIRNQIYCNIDKLYKDKLISKRLYELILRSKKDKLGKGEPNGTRSPHN